MVTSLQATRNAETKVNEFIQEWRVPANINKVLVLVEGKDDRIFYFKFFRSEATAIKDCGGCGKMKDIYPLLDATSICHIAIKDSDFARLNSIMPIDDNFFYADAHDYEMMCLNNENACVELFENLGIKYEDSLLEKVFRELNYLSFFKWFNYTYHSNYNFAPFSVEGLTDGQLASYSFIHGKVSLVSPRCVPIRENELNEFISSHASCDKYELTNGHDFIKRLCHHIKTGYTEHNKLNEERLRNVLHPCFRLDAFVQTVLYRDINVWENNRGKDILKKICN